MAVTQDLEVVVSLVDNASKWLKTLWKGFEDLGDKINDQTKGAQTFTLAVTWAAAAAWGLAVKEFAAFEKTMSWVEAVLKPTTDEFEQLTDLAIEQWRTTAFTSQQAAQWIEMLAKNWLDAADVLGGALVWSMDLAAAWGTNLWTAADITTDVMALWKINADEMAKATDWITWVMTTSKFTIDDYRLALAQGGWVAATVWVQLDDFNATISAISPLFASWSDAWTSFKVFLQRLVPASNAAAIEMEKLWLLTEEWTSAFFDAQWNMKEMTEIAWLLETAMAWLSDEQKNAALSTIFWTDAMRAAAWIADAWAEGFANLVDKIEGVSAADVAAKRLDNLTWDMTKLKSAASWVVLWFGEFTQENLSLRAVVQWLTWLINDFWTTWENLSPITQDVIIAIWGLAAAFGVLTIAVWAFGLIAPAALTALSAIAGVIGFLLSPIWLLVAAIVGLWIAWKTNFLGFQDFTSDLLTKLQPLFENIIQTFVDLWKGIMDFIDRVKEPFMQLVWFFAEVLAPVWELLTSFFESTFTNIVVILENAWNIIKWIFTLGFEVIAWVFEIFINLLTWNWSEAWDALLELTRNTLENLRGIFSSIFAIIWGIISQVMLTIKTLIMTTFTVIKSFIKTALDAIWINIVWIWEGIKNVTTIVWNWIKDFFGEVWDWIKEFFSKWWDAISEGWQKAMNWMKNIVMTVFDSIKQAIKNSINWVIEKINWLIDQANKVAWLVPWVGTIEKITPIAFQTGWIVPWWEWGIVAWSKLPANRDQIPALLDPGELILNRAQQKNLASQMLNEWTGGMTTIQVNVSGNSFFGDDDEFADKIGDTLTERLRQSLSIQSF